VSHELIQKIIEFLRTSEIGALHRSDSMNEIAQQLTMNLEKWDQAGWNVIINCDGCCYTYLEDKLLKLTYRGNKLIFWKASQDLPVL